MRIVIRLLLCLVSLAAFAARVCAQERAASPGAAAVGWAKRAGRAHARHVACPPISRQAGDGGHGAKGAPLPTLRTTDSSERSKPYTGRPCCWANSFNE